MNLHPSQLLLIAAMLLFALYVFRARSVLLDRLIYLALAAAGVGLILQPNFSTRVANWLGIGRGSDLLVYLFIVYSLFYAVSTRSRIKQLDRQMTTLVRHIALAQPLQGEAAPQKPDEQPPLSTQD